MMRAAALLVGLFVAAAAPACAETLMGRVIAIATGDTITVLDASKVQHRVRLAGIDAPDNKQPFDGQSRHYLAKWIFQRDVVVEWRTKDRDGKLVGIVIVDGHDVNLEQVRAGYAWWNRNRANEQAPEDQEVYQLAEQAARERKLGLWVDSAPLPPWEWRRR